jgi:hypothetical protein
VTALHKPSNVLSAKVSDNPDLSEVWKFDRSNLKKINTEEKYSSYKETI